MPSSRYLALPLLLLLVWGPTLSAQAPPERKPAWTHAPTSSEWKVVHASRLGVLLRSGKKIAGIDARTGKRRWEQTLPRGNTQLVTADKWVLLHAGRELHVIALATGKLAHKHKHVGAFARIDGTRIIVSGATGGKARGGGPIERTAAYRLPKTKLWEVPKKYGLRPSKNVAYAAGVLVNTRTAVRAKAKGPGGEQFQQLFGIDLRNGREKWSHDLELRRFKVWNYHTGSGAEGWRNELMPFATQPDRLIHDGKNLAVVVREVTAVTSQREQKVPRKSTFVNGLVFLNPRSGTRRKSSIVRLPFGKDDRPDSLRVSLVEDSSIVARYTHASRAEYRFELFSLQTGARRATVAWTGYDTLVPGMRGSVVLSGGAGGDRFEVREAKTRGAGKILFTGTGNLLPGPRTTKAGYQVLRKKADSNVWLQSLGDHDGSVRREVVAGRLGSWFGQHEQHLLILDRTTWKMRILDMKKYTAKAVVQCPAQTETVQGIKGGLMVWTGRGTVARIDLE